MGNLFLFLTDVVEQAPEVVDTTTKIGALIQRLISPEFIVAVVSVFLNALLTGVLTKMSKREKKERVSTIDDVIKAVQHKMDEENDVNIAKVIAPIVNDIKGMKQTNEIFIKVLALQQENTPESRLAILELLQSVGKVEDTTIKEAQEKVELQAKQEEENKQQAINELAEIEKQEEVAGRI